MKFRLSDQYTISTGTISIPVCRSLFHFVDFDSVHLGVFTVRFDHCCFYLRKKFQCVVRPWVALPPKNTDRNDISCRLPWFSLWRRFWFQPQNERRLEGRPGQNTVILNVVPREETNTVWKEASRTSGKIEFKRQASKRELTLNHREHWNRVSK